MQANPLEGNGWVVKAPYTTNCHYVKYPKDICEILNILRLATKTFFGKVSYMLIQPKLNNNRENKVVCLNGNAMFIAHIGSPKGTAFGCPSDLLSFAENSIKLLRRNCPHSITDGLVRVDIMMNVDGVFVVNEFESLEAIYYGKDIEEESIVKTFLIKYWYKKIEKFINELKSNC